MMSKDIPNKGSVVLVGAGPGDPDLLTVKALKAIQLSDCIVYDNLVSKPIRQLFPSLAQQIYVGKAKHHHSASQEEINQILLDCAQQGLRVCRVKGGDSFVFGRGAEEMLYLTKHHIEVDVIPGITAASGCTSYANIPLTHRGLTQGCTFITAHADKDLKLDWHALASLEHTLVIYMGLSKSRWLTEQLTQHGLCPTTPAALIEKGCTDEQRVVTGELRQLDQLREQHQIQSPALIVIGKVVSVAQQMEWLTALNANALQQESIPLSA
ncbi:uroporphyrinogen-III C-methyltransferase [Vibrio sp. WXL210]|uniref:uroporphyrinogen-III C-methyltransferase n=1 Tax=Vibrio sp. WXL210 TaxID=3450709 RepID=UPI003EC7663F